MHPIGTIVVWLVFGLIVGLLGRLFVPGPQPMGLLATIVLGVIGSFAGGFISYLVRGEGMGEPAGMIMSIIGAVVVLVIFTTIAKRSAA